MTPADLLAIRKAADQSAIVECNAATRSLYIDLAQLADRLLAAEQARPGEEQPYERTCCVCGYKASMLVAEAETCGKLTFNKEGNSDPNYTGPVYLWTCKACVTYKKQLGILSNAQAEL